MGFLERLLSEDGLPAHGYCLLWQPDLIALHAVSDAVIGVAYYSIPVALAYFVMRRRDLAAGWIFWLFAAFILACGTTHLMDIWVLWHPAYGLQGLIKALTAVVSAITAVVLWPLVVRALAFATPEQFRLVSAKLETETVGRREAEQSLQRSEQSLQMLVDGLTSHAIIMLDPRGAVMSWNAGAQRLFGYAAQEIIGHHFSVFHTRADRDAGLPASELEQAERDGAFQGELLRLRKDGTSFWAQITIQPLRDPSGRLSGYAKITQDIDARRAAEEMLHLTRERLAQAQKMESVGQLTGGVAHDFNNILTTILGSADLLLRRAQSESASHLRLLRAIVAAAERGSALTQRLLAFSRKQALSPSSVDVNQLIETVFELLQRTLGDPITVRPVPSPNLWRVFVDRNQLENAVLNLAINARDAMPEGGTLTLETANVVLDADYAAANAEVTGGDYVMLAVSDTGTGMSTDVLDRAFEPFFTTKPEGAGTGLGLSQVFGFIKQSGGHIKLYSEPGHGTTAKIYLPRRDADDAPARPNGRTHAPASAGGETVLLVEDHEAVRQFAADALDELGYRVLEAAEPQAALDLLQAHPDITLLFTDIGLPGLSGPKLATEALRRRPGLKVLFTSGYARNAIANNGLTEPGVHLLPKPYTVVDLARKLREAIDD